MTKTMTLTYSQSGTVCDGLYALAHQEARMASMARTIEDRSDCAAALWRLRDAWRAVGMHVRHLGGVYHSAKRMAV